MGIKPQISAVFDSHCNRSVLRVSRDRDSATLIKSLASKYMHTVNRRTLRNRFWSELHQICWPTKFDNFLAHR